MNFKKRVNGSWVDTPHYIHNTSTDTITTLPAVLYPNDTTATVGLKGNTVQNGTPTPENPIQPSGCGEFINEQYIIPVETAEDILVNNLTSQVYNGLTLTKNADGSVRVQGTAIANRNFHLYNDSHSATLSSYQIIDNGIYYIGGGIEGNEEGKYYLSAMYDDDTGGAPSRVLRIPYGENIRIDNSTGEYRYLSVYIAVWKGTTVDFTCKPYLKAGSTTNNIYLGEVQTTRKIKKLVLSGEESWSKDSDTEQSARYYTTVSDIESGTTNLLSSHFTQSAGYEIGTMRGYRKTIIFSVDKTICATVADFKSWLAAQYAAGTPVTVWYVLATEETGIVNEPLMKIGDYADEISGISIPVTTGGDTLSVNTTVQPSEVTVNYKGWHPIADVHERNNGAWT